MGQFVDIDGIPDSALIFMGYVPVYDDDYNTVFHNKGDVFVVPKQGARRLWVEEDDDAAILKNKQRFDGPPWA
jgi:hypothetical protein